MREKEEHQLTIRAVAERMGVSSVWVKKLWRRYEEGGRVPSLMRPRRRKVETSEHGRRGGHGGVHL